MPEPTSLPAPPPSRWRRWLVEPVLRQLQKGVTPEKIALTLALGFVLGVFPILGSTTLLVTAAAALLRLNQPIIQLVNYVAYPVQLLALLPFYHYGQRLFGQPPLSLSIPFLLQRFRADVGQFLRDFGLIALEESSSGPCWRRWSRLRSTSSSARSCAPPPGVSARPTANAPPPERGLARVARSETSRNPRGRR